MNVYLKCFNLTWMIFTESTPLGQFNHRVAMSVCVWFCAIGCSFFQGLSLSLRSHDQFQASHWSSHLLSSEVHDQIFNLYVICLPVISCCWWSPLAAGWAAVLLAGKVHSLEGNTTSFRCYRMVPLIRCRDHLPLWTTTLRISTRSGGQKCFVF